MGGLAAALQQAKLKRVEKPEEPNPVVASGTMGRTSSGGGGGGSSSGGGGGGGGGAGGMGDMMSEMQKKLAARRVKTENDGDGSSAGPPPPPTPSDGWRSKEKQPTPSPAQVNGSGSQSPKMMRKRNQSLTGQEAFGTANGGDLESLKQEILVEMRREVQRMKAEIIDAIRQELGHR